MTDHQLIDWMDEHRGFTAKESGTQRTLFASRGDRMMQLNWGDEAPLMIRKTQYVRVWRKWNTLESILKNGGTKQ